MPGLKLARCLLTAAALMAQAPAEGEPPKLTSTGAPIRLPFFCTEEHIRSFGLTCPNQQPCAVYLELSDLGYSGLRILLSGNLHTDTTTLFSVLLSSDDGGKTWVEPHERIRGAGLEQVQFFDLESGWIAGQLLGALPRDPFLLVTRDGGKTWRARPVFSESRVALIEHFQFDSKTHGTMWIDRTQAGEEGDRYAVLESGNGGESWAVRETSSRPIPKKKAEAAAVYRLRADAASRSYVVEKHTGNQWQRAASFLVQVGECREGEVAFPAEPQEPAVEPQEPKQP
ncbi:MAG: WD40/YVTN/BNR-like repeat-containing protein [Rhodospirillales bacterium]